MTEWYFTSDTHFDHKNIVNFMDRQSNTVEEMNELMIERWNAKVRPGDVVYHVGDFSFGSKAKILEVIDRLNGQIHLIFGNHDSKIRDTAELRAKFTSTDHFKSVKLDGHMISMFHAPILEWPWMERGCIHLHGHTHGSLVTTDCRRIDVGVDTTADLTPIHWELIKERALALPIRTRPSKD